MVENILADKSCDPDVFQDDAVEYFFNFDQMCFWRKLKNYRLVFKFCRKIGKEFYENSLKSYNEIMLR